MTSGALVLAGKVHAYAPALSVWVVQTVVPVWSTTVIVAPPNAAPVAATPLSVAAVVVPPVPVLPVPLLAVPPAAIGNPPPPPPPPPQAASESTSAAAQPARILGEMDVMKTNSSWFWVLTGGYMEKKRRECQGRVGAAHPMNE
jgi:hypothetical protein